MTSARFEVVAGTRRIFSAEQRAAFLVELAAGGTVSEVARRHNLHTSLLFRWRREAATLVWQSEQRNRAAVMLPVTVVAPGPATAPLCLPKSDADVVIELASGRVLRVSSDIDAVALKRIVAALEGP
jgi:transposase